MAALVAFGAIGAPHPPGPTPSGAPSGPTPGHSIPAESPSPQPAAGPANEFRGVWVTTVANLDFPSKPGLSVAELKAETDKILDNTREMGFDAIFLQVRPESDAFYPSEIFPWSRFLTGEQGKAPPGGFDPLQYFIEGAHARGLELHAWVNPLRAAFNALYRDAIAPGNPAALNPGWVKWEGGGAVYDPGLPEVRALVLDGIRELCGLYEIDGVHFDDYFYPQGGIDDAASHAAHGGGIPLDDWRRANINTLIREAQQAVREARPGARFGVSPRAIWQNADTDPRGSGTNGNPTYSSDFADTLLWVQEGWMDYIVPQIYWEIGHPLADYQTLLEWWAAAVRDTGVDLYIGQATWLSYGETGTAWEGSGEIKRQIALNRAAPEVKGSLHFRYALIAGNEGLRQVVKELNLAD